MDTPSPTETPHLLTDDTQTLKAKKPERTVTLTAADGHETERVAPKWVNLKKLHAVFGRWRGGDLSRHTWGLSNAEKRWLYDLVGAHVKYLAGMKAKEVEAKRAAARAKVEKWKAENPEVAPIGDAMAEVDPSGDWVDHANAEIEASKKGTAFSIPVEVVTKPDVGGEDINPNAVEAKAGPKPTCAKCHTQKAWEEFRQRPNGTFRKDCRKCESKARRERELRNEGRPLGEFDEGWEPTP